MRPLLKLFGYVTVEIQNANIEGILKRFARSGVKLRYIERMSYTRIRCVMDMRSWKKAKHTDGLRVIHTGGIMRVFAVLKRHAVLACIVLVGCAVIGTGAMLCLDTEVIGADTVSVPDIIAVVREYGGKTMRFKSSVDTDAITLAIRREFPQISYAYVHFDGVRLIVEVDEGVPEPDISKDEPCDIVAQKDGVITEITVLRGLAMVKEGSIVKKGDILIRGAYAIDETEIITSANGIVKAAVVYKGEGSSEYAEGKAVNTGKTSEERWMKLGRRWIRIYGKNTFDSYSVNIERTAAAGVHSPLTLELWNAMYSETKIVPSKEDLERARLAAQEEAYYNAVAFMPEEAEIMSVSCIYDEKDGCVWAEGAVVACEDIGVRAEVSPIAKEEKHED